MYCRVVSGGERVEYRMGIRNLQGQKYQNQNQTRFINLIYGPQTISVRLLMPPNELRLQCGSPRVASEEQGQCQPEQNRWFGGSLEALGPSQILLEPFYRLIEIMPNRTEAASRTKRARSGTLLECSQGGSTNIQC